MPSLRGRGSRVSSHITNMENLSWVFPVGAVQISSYHRLLACNLSTSHLRLPSADFCQVKTTRQPLLYGDASNNGGFISRHLRMPHNVQQQSFLSLSAAVSASATANLEVDMTLNAPVLDSADVVFDVATAASSAVEPTLQSLGLCSSFPGGLVQGALENLHIGLDVPWWQAIVIGTVIVRFIMFPLVILAQRNAAEMQNHLPTMQRLQQRMLDARRQGDAPGMLHAQRELNSYIVRNKVNPLKNFLVPMAQLPIFLSVFTGIREMATLPVASMQSGGMLWFKDLTIQDPYYALPLVMSAVFLLTVEIGTDGVAAAQMDKKMRFLMRAMPIAMIPVVAKFPAAMLCYWLTSSIFSLIQVMFLRIPAVRKLCKIPPLVDHKANTHIQELNVPKQSFMEGFREAVENMQLAREIEERQRYESLRIKKSTKETNVRQETETQSDSVSENVREKSKKSQQL